MKSIAFITKFSWVGISTSVINSAFFWESKGYEVDIYTEKPNQDKFPLPDVENCRINYIITDINKRFFLDDLYFASKYFLQKNYEFIISFDHTGLIRAGFTSFFAKNKIIYHSLEFFEPEKKTIRVLIEKYLEKWFAAKAKFVFIQDHYRAQFLKNDLGIKSDKIRLVYNSPTGNPLNNKSSYFRDVFGIEKEKKIVLCIGSLIKEHCIPLLLDSIDTWDEQFVLILHGWFPQRDIKEMALYKKTQFPQKIFFSEKLFKNNEKYIPYISSDIGFVGFLPLTNNLKYAAGSAGKIFDFMKTGLPVLAFDTPGMDEIVSGNKIGKVFKSHNEISSALLEIEKNHDLFKENMTLAYKSFEFNSRYNKTLDTLSIKE